MISLFRNFFKSKIGLPIFIGFLIIVALAFAASDISGSSTFGGIASSDKIATVGGKGVTDNEIRSAMDATLQRGRQQNPTLTMEELIADGALDDVIDRYNDRFALGEFARKYGLRAGENLVNSEILKEPAFRNLTGEFDEETYRRVLADARITDAIMRRDISDGLLAQQLLGTAVSNAKMPIGVARQYAALELERRTGSVGLVPSLLFAPEGDPTEEQLTTYYTANRTDYVIPERRNLRFITFGPEAIEQPAAPTEEEIAAAYQENAATYAANELRAITSFVVPTQAGAKALVERIRGGVSIEKAATDAGFQTAKTDARDKETMSSGASFALAEAVFATEQGGVTEPAQTATGWTIARVDSVVPVAARSLNQVRGEIAEQLLASARLTALNELSGRVNDMVQDGTALGEIARELNLEMTEVPGVMADGQIYGSAGQGVNEALRPALANAFQMEQGRPQISELVRGTQFMVMDVSEITEAAAPPLADVKELVSAAWKRAEGSVKAKEAAERILAAVRDGKSLRDAMRQENTALTQINPVDMRRSDLQRFQQGRPPAALALMFAMASDTVKLLEDGNDIGWYLIDLDTIEADPIEDNEQSRQMLEQMRTQIAAAIEDEYSVQLLNAIGAEIGIERNEEAIEALRAAMTEGR